MSNEITVSMFVKVDNGYLQREFKPGNVTLDQTAIGRGGDAQTITSAAETAISFGDLTAPGVVCLRNLSETLVIYYGPSDGTSTPARYAAWKISPGMVALFELDADVALLATCDADGSSVGTALLDVFGLET